MNDDKTHSSRQPSRRLFRSRHIHLHDHRPRNAPTLPRSWSAASTVLANRLTFTPTQRPSPRGLLRLTPWNLPGVFKYPPPARAAFHVKRDTDPETAVTLCRLPPLPPDHPLNTVNTESDSEAEEMFAEMLEDEPSCTAEAASSCLNKQ